MKVTEIRAKCKAWLARQPQDLLIVIVLVLVAMASFGLGYLAGKSDRPEPILIQRQAGEDAGPEVVASAGGSVYYFPWCAGADRISERNRRWFSSPEAAEAQGYAPASNCDGL